jgi:hypothetical protein
MSKAEQLNSDDAGKSRLATTHKNTSRGLSGNRSPWSQESKMLVTLVYGVTATLPLRTLLISPTFASVRSRSSKCSYPGPSCAVWSGPFIAGAYDLRRNKSIRVNVGHTVQVMSRKYKIAMTATIGLLREPPIFALTAQSWPCIDAL